VPVLGAANDLVKKEPTLEPFPVEINISGQIRIKDRWSIPVELTFENKGTSTIELDKFSIVFDGELKNDMFKISSGDKAIEYIGMAVRRAPPGPKGFVKLKPREIVKTKFDLGKTYRFPDSGGTYTIKYETRNAFSKNLLSLVSDSKTFTLPSSP
jgi:hypothetical protein